VHRVIEDFPRVTAQPGRHADFSVPDMSACAALLMLIEKGIIPCVYPN
jgi:hypothetical protein